MKRKSNETLEAYQSFYGEETVKEKDAENFLSKAWNGVNSFWQGISKESEETKQMAKSFYHMLEHKLKLNERSTPPTEEEVKAAIDQLKDMGRFGVFISVSILPGGAFSLLGLELLAHKLGVKRFTFIPSAFRQKIRKDKKSINPDEKPK